jgi:Domain of unknown function (DUF1992)
MNGQSRWAIIVRPFQKELCFVRSSEVSDFCRTGVYVISLNNLNRSKSMSIESAIEKQIQEAIARGEFDNLSGKGKPLDLDAYFNTPEDLRMAFAMLKSNEFVPEEVEIFREMAELDERMKDCTDESEQTKLAARREERRLKLMLMLDARRRKR